MIRNTIKYGTFLLLATFILILASEGGLWLLWKATHKNVFKLQQLESSFTQEKVLNQYPSNPNDYIKIAVFGGSAANGYNAERGFADILKYTLTSKYPQLKFYIKNYAEDGRPFHRYEAELAKQVADRYDILLIYAGTNEALNYINDSGYFVKSKFKKLNTSKLPSVAEKDQTIKSSEILDFLSAYSRLFSFALKLREKFAPVQENIYQTVKFKEVEDKPILSAQNIEELIVNYASDLRSVATIAKKFGHRVIVSSETTDLFTRPIFSVHRQGLLPDQLSKFSTDYTQGLEHYNAKNFSKALVSFRKAFAIDSDFAILNYWLGRALIASGQMVDGYHFLNRSKDHDGLTNRAITALSIEAGKINDNFDNVTFIDTAKSIEFASIAGYTPAELFSDFVHPTMLGHVILAHKFLCTLADLKPMKDFDKPNECTRSVQHDFRKITSELKLLLNVTPAEESKNAFMVARMNISLASRASYPEDFLIISERSLPVFFEKSAKQKDNKANYYLYLFLVEGFKTNPDRHKALGFINSANESDPGFVANTLKRSALATGEAVSDTLLRIGITYSPHDKVFLLK